MNQRGIISTSFDASHRGLLDRNMYLNVRGYTCNKTVARIGILFVSEWVVSYTRSSWRQRYPAIISDMATSRCSTPMFRGWLRSFLPLSHPTVALSFSTCVARRREGGRQGLWINTRATADPASQPASQPARFSRHPLSPASPFTTTFSPPRQRLSPSVLLLEDDTGYSVDSAPRPSVRGSITPSSLHYSSSSFTSTLLTERAMEVKTVRRIYTATMIRD